MQTNQTTQQQKIQPCIITIGAKETNTLTFDLVVIQAVDTVFSTLNNKQNIYRQLETKYALSLLEIADDSEAFSAALKDMFDEASLLIELKIISQLHSKSPDFKYYVGKDQELTLSGYLSGLKNFLA